jgi:hypothetical protein
LGTSKTFKKKIKEKRKKKSFKEEKIDRIKNRSDLIRGGFLLI